MDIHSMTEKTYTHHNCTSKTPGEKFQQDGYTLVSVLLILIVVGIMASGSMELSLFSEKAAGNAIQRSRSFQAADGGAAIAENNLQSKLGSRVFSDSIASEGVFSTESYTKKWWRSSTYAGEQSTNTDALLGVIQPPRYILEEIGQYVTDGGTGVAALDIGSSSYGSRSRSGRDVVVYRIESHGKGSFNEVQSVVESVVGFSY